MSLVYLDSNIVIYLVEHTAIWGEKVVRRLTASRPSGQQVFVSDLTRTECRIGPLMTGDQSLLAEYDRFFTAPDLKVLPLTARVCDRAAEIRAEYRFKLGDSLNLAAAVEARCDQFLTNGLRLARFATLNVETVI